MTWKMVIMIKSQLYRRNTLEVSKCQLYVKREECRAISLLIDSKIETVWGASGLIPFMLIVLQSDDVRKLSYANYTANDDLLQSDPMRMNSPTARPYMKPTISGQLWGKIE
jgi:hypothetical protein